MGFPASTGCWFWNEVHHDNSPQRQRQGLLHSIKLILGTFPFFFLLLLMLSGQHEKAEMKLWVTFQKLGGWRSTSIDTVVWGETNTSWGVEISLMLTRQEGFRSRITPQPPLITHHVYFAAPSCTAPSSSIVFIQASLHPLIPPSFPHPPILFEYNGVHFICKSAGIWSSTTNFSAELAADLQDFTSESKPFGAVRWTSGFIWIEPKAIEWLAAINSSQTDTDRESISPVSLCKSSG